MYIYLVMNNMYNYHFRVCRRAYHYRVQVILILPILSKSIHNYLSIYLSLYLPAQEPHDDEPGHEEELLLPHHLSVYLSTNHLFIYLYPSIFLFRNRMKMNQDTKEENYYYLTIDSNRMIDAGPKGNAAR